MVSLLSVLLVLVWTCSVVGRSSLFSGVHAATGKSATEAKANRSRTSKSGGKGGSQVKSRKVVSSPSASSRFLAKLLPHNDDCFLIEFHSDNNDHSKQMEPVLQRLEEDLRTKVRRVNVSRRREFYGLMEAMGHDECGSLPFYYNRRTAQAVCGATSYLNLKRWATGDLKHLFQDPPENMFEQEVDNSRKRKVGAGGFLQEKLVGTGDKKEEKQEEPTKAKSKKEKETSAVSTSSDKVRQTSPSTSQQVGAKKARKSAKQLRVARKNKAKRESV
jgi:hypothetical protein